MSSKNLKPQTPGAPTVPPAAPAPAANPATTAPTEAAQADLGKPGTGDDSGADASETVTLSKAQFEELMGRMNALEKRNTPASRVANSEVELPDQSQVDPKKITTTVLTKQGWVVPEGYGDNPALRKF